MSSYRSRHVSISDVHATPVKDEATTMGKSMPQRDQYMSPVAPASARDVAQRKAQQPGNVLLAFTVQWAETLPENLRPRTLMHEFPRVANMVALLWTEPTRTPFDEYMDGLLMDQRGNRQGFPPSVVTDLLNLRAAFEERRFRR